MRTITRLLLTAALLVLPSALPAQADTARKGSSPKESKPQGFAVPRERESAAFSEHLFPPELIMQNQGRLRITEAQRTAILKEISKLQAIATQVQWRVAEEAGKLNDLLERETATESEVLSQAERMMSYEVAVKRAQLEMLVRIRNLLTSEQKEILRSLRRSD